MKEKKTSDRKQITGTFSDFVSSGKAAFFKKYGMDFIMGSRSGPYLNDIDGKKELFNLHCNGGVFNLGHRNPELTECLKNSLDELDIGNHHLISRERALLAELLAGLMPGNLQYCIFGVSGGESVDLAIKVARAYTGRARIISAIGGYHGHTGLSMAAGDRKYSDPFGPVAPGFFQVPFNNIQALKDAMDTNTAAVIFETIPATLGMVMADKDYFRKVKQICIDSGSLLILDEVQSGLGRTGKLWAFEHFSIVPDMVVLGKGLSGGIYPITATVLDKKLESVFHADPFIHISTFGGAEPGCRVARKVLEISSDAAFLNHVNKMAAVFRSEIQFLMEKHGSYLKGFRQMGLMMGLVLRDELAGPILTKTAYNNGLLLIYANNDTSVCQLLPPLNMEESQVNAVITRLDKAIAEATRLYPIVKTKRNLDKWFSNIFN